MGRGAWLGSAIKEDSQGALCTEVRSTLTISSRKEKKDQSEATRTGKDPGRSNWDLWDFDLWVIMTAFLTIVFEFIQTKQSIN